jgi:hypothetical protein
MKLERNVPPKKVSGRVFEGLEAVRKAGTTNMFDWRVVCIQAVALGYPEAQAWIENNTETYVEGIFTGFEFDGSPDKIEGLRLEEFPGTHST